jgi:hypothetical protein
MGGAQVQLILATLHSSAAMAALPAEFVVSFVVTPDEEEGRISTPHKFRASFRTSEASPDMLKIFTFFVENNIRDAHVQLGRRKPYKNEAWCMLVDMLVDALPDGDDEEEEDEEEDEDDFAEPAAKKAKKAADGALSTHFTKICPEIFAPERNLTVKDDHLITCAPLSIARDADVYCVWVFVDCAME